MLETTFSNGSEQLNSIQAFFEHRLQFFNKVPYILELPVDARKSHECDLIEPAQVLHYQFSQVSRWHLCRMFLPGFQLYRSNDFLKLLITDGTFPACLFQSDLDLVPIECGTGAVLLDDFEYTLLRAFESNELALTGQAFSLAPAGKPILGRAALQDPIIVLVAVRAADRIVNSLVGTVASLTVQALAATPDCRTILAGSRVSHAIVVVSALRAFHGFIVEQLAAIIQQTQCPAQLSDPQLAVR